MLGAARLGGAQLWAEDGKLFLAQALELGPRSLLVAYDGYLHTLPRMFAYGWVTLFGITRYATALTVFCYAALAGVMALFALPSFAWLNPSRVQRTLLAALLLLAPGLSEVLGNLANLHYVLFVGMALFALRSSAAQTSPFALVALSVGFLTEGAVWLLALPYGLRLVVRWREGRRVLDDVSSLVLIALAGALHVAAYVQGLQRGATSRAALPLYETVRGLLVLLSERLVLMPWALGEGIAHLRPYGAKIEVLVGIAPLLVLVLMLVRRFGALRAAWVLSLPLTFMALLAMTFVVRPGTLDIIVGHPIGYRARYAFASHLPATLAWAAALPLLGRLWSRRAVALLVGLQVALGAKELPYRAYAPQGRSWRAALAQPAHFDAAGRRCIPIAPDAWEACLPAAVR